MKTLLGLSGGVDSTVAGAILKERGDEVTAVFLTHSAIDPSPAVRAAKELGVELIIEDISEGLESEVFPAFEEAYSAGRTPNPCVLCNPAVKFFALEKLADRLGCDRIATGHYARVVDGTLRKALSANDQSYMLCRLSPDLFPRLEFPLGEFASKEEVRNWAAKRGITAASRPDSMEICFIPDGDYAAWLRSRGVEDEPGDFVDESGNVLGRHGGILGYTVGMRRGLGVSADSRLYVKRIDPITNRITLAKENDMYTDVVRLSSLHTVSIPLEELPGEVTVKLRHSPREELAKFVPSPDLARAMTMSLPPRLLPFYGGSAQLHLVRPVRIPAPGQFAAIYVDDVLAGSGIIEG